METISLSCQASQRSTEASMHFDCAHHLAQLMPSIPQERKRATAKAILMRLRYALASSQAAAFWRAQGGR